MSIIFANAALLAQHYQPTLQALNNPTPLLPAEGFAEPQIIRRWLLRSRTARSILALIDASPQRIVIVASRGEGTTVFGANEPVAGMGTVYWDVAARYAIGGGTPGDFHHAVTILHELGHAEQWIEHPDFYAGNMLHTTGAGQIRTQVQNRFRKIVQGRGGTFRKAKEHADNMTVPSTTLPAPLAWSVRLEMDNLNRHEWPICDEARLPRRLHYTDLMTI